MTTNIKLLMGTQTGTAEDVAKEVRDALKAEGIEVEWRDLADQKKLDFLKEATCILGVVSTWGDGEPPDDSLPFFEQLRRSEPLGLAGVPMSVLALGDTAYDQFCESGKELERELVRHGATVFVPRVDCDTWYDDELKGWIEALLAAFAAVTGETA